MDLSGNFHFLISDIDRAAILIETVVNHFALSEGRIAATAMARFSCLTS